MLIYLTNYDLYLHKYNEIAGIKVDKSKNHAIIVDDSNKGVFYMGSLKFIRERTNDYDANKFVNELSLASKYLGILEGKISGYQFNSILIPLLHKKEAASSMYIEGTQTTISDLFEVM